LSRLLIIILVFLLSSSTNSAIDQAQQNKSEQENNEKMSDTNDPALNGEEDEKSNDDANGQPSFLSAENVRTVTQQINGQEVIANPENLVAIVNKTKTLPSSYEPIDLVIPNIPFIFEEIIDKRFLRKEAADSIEKLFIAADEDNIELYAVSGYRSYERQADIYQYQVNLVGLEQANQLVALPGQSEHQLGLALDITSYSVELKLTEEFGETSEGRWLAENAHRFGFTIRYPLGKEQVTGYQYEPWHIRYVGTEVAEYLHKNDLLLEQVFAEIQ
jgi:D-alanyl-D-alanine carboxypeptidase